MVARLQVSSKKVLRSKKLLKVWQALISMVAGIGLTLKHTLWSFGKGWGVSLSLPLDIVWRGHSDE